MEEFIYNGILFNIYKPLLNKTNIKYYSLYYEDNLSLQEIANINKVSKSYIGNIIKKTTNTLYEYENKLNIYKKRIELEKLNNIEDINILKNKLNKILDN